MTTWRATRLLRSFGFRAGRGGDVKGFQRAFAGYTHGGRAWNLKVDGVLGPNTKHAVEQVRKTGRLSKHVRVEDMRSKGDKTTKANRSLLRKIDLAVDRYNNGVWKGASSGYRDPAHNRKVGGVSNSQHLTGKAIDFEVPFLTLAEARRLNFGGIGRNRSSGLVSHVDVGPKRKPWYYNR